MTDIYDQHDRAFARVNAFVIVKATEPVEGVSKTECVATIAFKHPRDGAGRLYAYVHWLGIPMVRGSANGGGYDKHSAACSAAVPALLKARNAAFAAWTFDADKTLSDAFIEALAGAGLGWARRLRDAGFKVWEAV